MKLYIPTYIYLVFLLVFIMKTTEKKNSNDDEMMIFTYVFVNRKKKHIYNDKCDCVSVIEYTWRDLMFFVYDTNTPWICFFLFIWYFTMLYSYVVWIRNFNGFCCYSFLYKASNKIENNIIYMILIDWITSKKKQNSSSWSFLIVVMGCLVVTGNYLPWIDERRSTCTIILLHVY